METEESGRCGGVLNKSQCVDFFLSAATKKSPGGTPHMKGVGLLVVSRRGVNCGFSSHLECSGQNAIIFSREGLV